MTERKFPPHHANDKSVRSSDSHTGPAPSHSTPETILQKSNADDLITRESILHQQREKAGAHDKAGQHSTELTKGRAEVKPGK